MVAYEPKGWKYKVTEQFVMAKTGNADECEDVIHLSEHFAAVIDGATSKTDRQWNGKTGGRTAAEIIDQVFARLPARATAVQAVTVMTEQIANAYNRQHLEQTMQKDPGERITASFVAVSLTRQELWLVGDCQALLATGPVTNSKLVDHITSEARALFLELQLLKGRSVNELLESKAGREFIMPLLREQARLQNNTAAKEYGYAVIDGFPVPTAKIVIQKLSPVEKSIILASDGYAELYDSLVETEKKLQQLLEEDPLLMRKHKSTKGMYPGWVSFDDRAYLRIELL